MSHKIDLLNIGLIIVSLIIAVMLPFELFLFSYAILGPLHYLTEINWLKDKKYFVQKNSKWIRVFLLFAILVSIYPVYKIIDFSIDNSFMQGVTFALKNTSFLLLSGFLFAIGLIFFKKISHLIIMLAVSILLSILLYYFLPTEAFFVGLFLPTIIHVYFFTGLFMLYGASKSSSKVGYGGAVLLLLVPFIIAFININPSDFSVSQETSNIYSSSGMIMVTAAITKLFGGLRDGQFIALSPIAIKAQIFIAFAYTYHYLNWFSKTSIIGWKNALTTRKTVYIALIWAAAVSLYLYDFYTGLIALYFLSILHVFFEFPLNAITIKELFKFRRAKVAT